MSVLRVTNIGDKFNQLLKAKGMTQRQLHQQTGICNQSINRFCKGKADITSSKLITLLSKVGIDIENEIEKRLSKDFENFDIKVGQLEGNARKQLEKLVSWYNSVAAENKETNV